MEQRGVNYAVLYSEAWWGIQTNKFLCIWRNRSGGVPRVKDLREVSVVALGWERWLYLFSGSSLIFPCQTQSAQRSNHCVYWEWQDDFQSPSLVVSQLWKTHLCFNFLSLELQCNSRLSSQGWKKDFLLCEGFNVVYATIYLEINVWNSKALYDLWNWKDLVFILTLNLLDLNQI